jgi:hypothetical protein
MLKDRRLWAILILGAAVRLFGLGDRSLSYDECQQFWASRGNPLISNREITLDPPLFAALLRVYSLPSRSDLWLRLLPCLFGVLAIPAVAGLARAAGGDASTARLAALFTALAPYPIRYSQSLRVYALTLLMCALLPGAYLAARKTGGTREWARTGILACAALLTMYGAVWIVLAMAILSVWDWRRRATPGAARGVLAIVGAAAGALPFYLASLPAQMGHGTPAAFYEDKFLPAGGLLPGLRFLARATLELWSYLSFIHPAAGLLFGALAGAGAIFLFRRVDGRIPALLFLLSVAAAAAASMLRLYPYGGTRQMLFAGPLFFVLVAAGVAGLRPAARGIIVPAFAAALIAGAGIFLYRYHTEPAGQEMRPVLRSLQRRSVPGDRILVNKDAVPQFRFYYRGPSDSVVLGRETVIRDYVAEVNRILGSHPSERWWLVFSHGWSAGRRAELAGVDRRFRAGERIEAHQAGAYLFVPIAERAGGAGSTPP